VDWENNSVGLNIPGYVKDYSGKYYKYNMEVNGIYYCPDNIIIEEGEATRIGNDKGTIILTDYYKIDLERKSIELIDDTIEDSFLETIENIEKIEIENDKSTKTKRIKIIANQKEQPIVIEIDRDNQIVGYENQQMETTGNGFMQYNTALKKINIPHVKIIGEDCLVDNENLKVASFPEVEEIDDNFLKENEIIEEVSMPYVKNIGDNCLYHNKNIQILNLPMVRKIGECFLYLNKNLSDFNCPNLVYLGDDSLNCNIKMESFIAPKLENAGINLLFFNTKLKEINLNSAKKVANNIFICAFDGKAPKSKDFRGKGTVRVEVLKKEIAEREEKSVLGKIKKFFTVKFALKNALNTGIDYEDIDEAEDELDNDKYLEEGIDKDE
jgi:hypothetical protein